MAVIILSIFTSCLDSSFSLKLKENLFLNRNINHENLFNYYYYLFYFIHYSLNVSEKNLFSKLIILKLFTNF